MHDYFTVCPNGGFYNYRGKHICDYTPMSFKCIMCNCDVRSYPQKIYRVLRQLFQSRAIFKNKEINIISISNHTREAVLPFNWEENKTMFLFEKSGGLGEVYSSGY